MARVKRSDAVANATNASNGQPGPINDYETPAPATPQTTGSSIVRALQIALTVVSLIAVGLLIAVIILATRSANQQDAPASPTTATAEPTAAPTPVFFSNYISVAPGMAKPDAIVVEIHTDYQCPWCGRAEQIYGQALYELSQSGDVDLRIHLRTMVGDSIIYNDDSRRSAIAAVCAEQVDAFWAYHSAVFAHQPEEGAGFPDTQLRNDFAAEAGMTGDTLTRFQTCYDQQATTAEVTAMENEGIQAGVNGTPTFFVNGLRVNFELQANAAAVTPITAANLLANLKTVVGQ